MAHSHQKTNTDSHKHGHLSCGCNLYNVLITNNNINHEISCRKLQSRWVQTEYGNFIFFIYMYLCTCIMLLFRDHPETITGVAWRRLRGHPDFTIYWRGAPRFCQSSDGGTDRFCQILILKNPEIAQIRP